MSDFSLSLLSRTAALCAVFLAVSSSAFAQTPVPSGTAPLTAGTVAPAFTTKTVAGKPLTLKSLRGRIVLLDYWATWCGPCRMSTPTLEALQRQFGGRGLRVIGLSLDDATSRAHISAFKKQFGITYTLAYSPQANYQAALAYHTNQDPNNPGSRLDNPVPPSVFLIDRRGIVRWSQIGYSLDEKQILTRLIHKLLAEKA